MIEKGEIIMEKRKSIIFGNIVALIGILIIISYYTVLAIHGGATSISFENMINQDEELSQAIQEQYESDDITLSKTQLNMLLGMTEIHQTLKNLVSFSFALFFLTLFVVWPAFQSNMTKDEKTLMILAKYLLLADMLMIILIILLLCPFTASLSDGIAGVAIAAMVTDIFALVLSVIIYVKRYHAVKG